MNKTKLKSLPPLVAAVVQDVVHNNVTAATIELARKATPEEFKKYDVIRCIAAGNPDCPPTEEAMWLVKEMIL
jgi:NCAIR mutase (PurE)-related protein